MKKITRMIFAVAVVLLLHAQLMFAAAPEITADAAIVIDSATGEAVYEKNADEIGYPASMTKMLTCIIGLEKGVPDSVVCISPTAAD
ncbi:MAG: D-alanyl-D-alanine carboxypeptidase, partial [Selenomonadaceae bacterium]|nr:D-alanyl-D-alanine carboxypeptidase [Selenomonadaceae bacterium]